MKTLSLAEFSESTWQDWYAYASKEVKNATIEDTLPWLSYEGIIWQPYYDAAALPAAKAEAIQKAQRRSSGWKTMASIVVENNRESAANEYIRSLAGAGVDAFLLDLSGIETERVEATTLLNGVRMADTPLFFRTNEPAAWLGKLAKVAPANWQGGLVNVALAEQVEEGKELVSSVLSDERLTSFKLYELSTAAVHQKGGNAVQELAFLLYNLNTFLEKTNTPEHNLQQTRVEVVLHPNYFLSIAQVRAARFLLHRLAAAYELNFQPYIQGITSAFYQTGKSPNTNILRATTEAMAGVIGGCDALLVLPHDWAVGEAAEFSTRIAKNISLLLKEEAYLHATTDPAAGSYFIEFLTASLADKAWEAFLEMKNQNTLDAFWQQVERLQQKRIADYAAGKVMVGVNKFQVAGDEVTVSPEVPRMETLLAN